MPLSSAGGTQHRFLHINHPGNIGTISNRGWEISADFDIVKSKDWLSAYPQTLPPPLNKIVKLPEQNKRKRISHWSIRKAWTKGGPACRHNFRQLSHLRPGKVDMTTIHTIGQEWTRWMDSRFTRQILMIIILYFLTGHSLRQAETQRWRENWWDANGIPSREPPSCSRELQADQREILCAQDHLCPKEMGPRQRASYHIRFLRQTYAGRTSTYLQCSPIRLVERYTTALIPAWWHPGQSAGNYHVDLYNNAWRINDRSKCHDNHFTRMPMMTPTMLRYCSRPDYIRGELCRILCGKQGCGRQWTYQSQHQSRDQ